jgi:2Fe-2S ferredoxin
MPRIKFIAASGTVQEVDAPEGHSLMEVALANGVPGIVAECGGACSCATCHVYVSDAWLDKLTPPNEIETAMLEFGEDEVRPSSRLSCQIELHQALDGLVIKLPK